MIGFGQSLVCKIYHFFDRKLNNSDLMVINKSTYPAVYRWRPACWLKVSGEDAATFLQGQFTNDLRVLSAHRSVYGLWLTLKGKVLADSFVLRGAVPNEFWIGSYFSPAALIRERIESHVIADDVTVEDFTADWTGICLLGDEATPTVEEAKGFGLAFAGRRQAGSCVEWVFPLSADEPPGLAELVRTASAVDEVEMRRRRILAGIPAIPSDVGPADLPNEAGLEADAISYTKGCYLGQEVMARLKSMGQVRRRLVQVRGSGHDFPATPSAVFVGARQVGELRSAIQDGPTAWIGLAMVSLLHVSAETEFSFAADGPPSFRLMRAP